MKTELKTISKFVFYGGLSTLATYVIFLLINPFMHYQIAFFIAYCLGVVISYFLNVYVVFKAAFSFKNFMMYPLIYLVQYLLSALILNVTIEHFAMSEKSAPLLAILLTTPVTYILNKWMLARKPKK